MSANLRKSSALAAAAVGGLSARSVEMTKTIHKYAPDLLPDVRAGRLRLHAAYQQTRERVLSARALGLDVDPRCRIRPSTADPTRCPHCAGTGRLPGGAA